MSDSNTTSVSVNFGGIIWFCLGFFCSFMVNHSIFWAIVHGILGPFYILYLCLGFGGGFDGVDQGINEMISVAPIEQTYEA